MFTHPTVRHTERDTSVIAFKTVIFVDLTDGRLLMARNFIWLIRRLSTLRIQITHLP